VSGVATTGVGLGASDGEPDATGKTVLRVNRAVVAHRVVQAGIMLTLMWKWSFFVLASRVYEEIPLADPFFPSVLQSIGTVRTAFLGCVFAVGLNTVTGNRTLQKICCYVTFVGASVLCLHQATYNDMTFVTAWWTSLWAMWFVRHIDDADRDRALDRAAFLSRLIISVILLGGAAGKWTAEYWSGQVFYDIYFRDRDFWVFNLLREHFEGATLRDMACWYSRKVILIETVAGASLWAMPPKWAAAVAVVILASIALLSNFLLFSVLFSLIGLASVGFFVAAPQRSP
jgi:hypothetical protein